MKTYSRKFTDDEILSIGPDGFTKIDSLISSFILAAARTRNGSTTTPRILSVIHNNPVTIQDIMKAHDNKYGSIFPPAKIDYTRSVVNKLYSQGVIKRVSHGKYVKRDK